TLAFPRFATALRGRMGSLCGRQASGIGLASAWRQPFPEEKINLVERDRFLREQEDEPQAVGEKRAAIRHVTRLLRSRSADALRPPEALHALRAQHVLGEVVPGLVDVGIDLVADEGLPVEGKPYVAADLADPNGLPVAA